MDRSRTLPLLALLVSMSASAQPAFHWTLDESSGSVAHEVNNLSNGTLQGGALWDPDAGHHAGACRFDGVDDRIILGPCDLTNGNGNITLSVWVKPDFVTAMERTIIAKTIGPTAQDHIWSLAFVNASALRFRLRTANVTTELSTPTSSIFSGVWYHVAATYDGAAMRIYLNGALMAENMVSGSMGFHPQAPASLGARSNGAHPFSGWIDDVRIYDQAMTQSGIIDILLEDELTTAVLTAPVQRPLLLPDGRFQLPYGPWTELTVLDAAGRIVSNQRVNGLAEALAWSGPSKGVYLLCAQGDGQRAAWPIVIP